MTIRAYARRMKTLHIGIALSALLAIAGCSKKDNGGGASGDKASAKSGLAWTPVNYGDMSEKCKKALACCEAVAAADGAKSAEDFNGKCSGPAIWKEADCEMDLKARVAGAEGGKPLPDACK